MDEVDKKNIKLIKEIGEREKCEESELKELMPHFPTPRGSETIFKINFLSTLRQELEIEEDIVNYIKGLHFVELKYRELTDSVFGFGSPSSSAKLIEQLSKKDPSKASDLYNWISQNGGNYYIENN